MGWWGDDHPVPGYGRDLTASRSHTGVLHGLPLNLETQRAMLTHLAGRDQQLPPPTRCSGRDGAYSATLVRALLAAEQESTRDAVLLNVVAGLTAAGPTAHGPRLGRLLVGAILPLLSRIIQTTRSVPIGRACCRM